MALLDAFVGVPQSKVAAFAIMVAFAVMALAIVLGDISVPPSYRLLTVVFMIVMSIPSILITLVNITCAVSGSAGGKWWCDIWAWVLTGFVAFYSILLVVAAMMVMSNKAQIQKDGAAQTGIAVANKAAEGFFQGGEDGEEMEDVPAPAPPGFGEAEPEQDVNVTNLDEVQQAQGVEMGGGEELAPVPEAFTSEDSFASL